MEKTEQISKQNTAFEAKQKQNKMGTVPMGKLIWKMGLPMIISMILQSIYNIVDTAFVINMGADGESGNLALTYAFPIQILIIAVGVGTGVGINALLSKKLGEKDSKSVSLTTGNGVFLGICLYVVFLLFGLFGSHWFISMQAAGNAEVIEMGTSYLKICCCLSLGAIGYSIFERFLQSTGKTLHSTIAQISGAVANIVLDYVFIYPCKMGIEGAAWATVIGQILSLVVAMGFHYFTNKEIKNTLKSLLPKWGIIKAIYQIGISAALMQGLLAVMMLGMNLILGTTGEAAELLTGSFGIYYKIMQFALFAAFGISNTIISILSFNFGMQDKARVKSCIKWGIVDSVIVAAIIMVLFQCLASLLAKLFGMAGGASGSEITSVVVTAIRISSISYVFMAASVAIQGVLQAFRYAIMPLAISLLRLCVLVLPIAYLFTLANNVQNVLWWTFLIVEVATAAVSFGFLLFAFKKKVVPMQEKGMLSEHLIVTISREHGSNGKHIGTLVAEKLGISYFDKEILGQVAKETGLAQEYIEDITENPKTFHTLFLSTETNQEAIIAQSRVIGEIAKQGDCVIVGRGADHILRNCPNLFKVFVFADEKTKVQNIMKMYGDSEEDARKNMKRSDSARAAYYSFISGKQFGDAANYDLCIDSSVGAEQTADEIVKAVQNSVQYSAVPEKKVKKGSKQKKISAEV